MDLHENLKPRGLSSAASPFSLGSAQTGWLLASSPRVDSKRSNDAMLLQFLGQTATNGALPTELQNDDHDEDVDDDDDDDDHG